MSLRPTLLHGCLLVGSLLLGGCAGELRIAVEARHWQDATTSVDTLLTILPALPRTIEPQCADWRALLIEAARLNGLPLRLIATDDLHRLTGPQLDALTQLKREMEWALAQQGFGGGTASTTGGVQLHALAPRLVGDYRSVGCRYVALQGIRLATPEPQQVASLFHSDALREEGNWQGAQYYLVVADLERHVVVYREVRDLRARVTCSTLKSVFYDSFKYLRH